MPRILPRHLWPVALALLLGTAPSGFAAELPLTLLLASDADLLQVSPLARGGAAVLRAGALDRLAADGALAARSEFGSDQQVFLSDDGAFAGFATHRPGAADFAPTASFELRDAAGTALMRLGPTEDVGYSISARGAVVGKSLNINAPERSALHFYGRDGALIREAPIPHLLGGRFSEDGAVYFAQSATAGLIAFDAAGAELWRRAGVRLFAAAPDGRRVAAITEGGLELLSAGAVTARADLAGLLVRRIAFAPDGERIAIAAREELRLYDARLQPIWRESLAGRGLVVTGVDLAAQGGWLVAGVARDLGPRVPVAERHPGGAVFAFDASGRLCHEARLAFDAWNIFTPTPLLDDAGKTLTITTRRAVYRTTLP